MSQSEVSMRTEGRSETLTPVRSRRQHQDEVGAMLDKGLPVQWFITLTSPTPMTDIERDDLCEGWIKEVQRIAGFTIGYIRRDGSSPYRHIHVVLVSYRPLPESYAKQAWLNIIGQHNQKCIDVRRYHVGDGALSDMMKADGDDYCQWRMSDNLSAFSSERHQDRTTSRQRRQARRVQAQRQHVSAYRPGSDNRFDVHPS